MKRVVLFTFLAALLVFIAVAVVKTNEAIKLARTFDTIGMVTVAMDKTLTIESWNKGYDAASEACSKFPDLKTSDGAILDAWGNPIHIEIHRSAKSFSVRIVSAGIDRNFGTADDCVREFQLMDEPISLK